MGQAAGELRLYDFDLPERLIAQAPAARRDQSRLLTLGRRAGPIEHRSISALPTLLSPGALLVLNDTRVIPARLRGTKPTGGRMELLLCQRLDGDRTEAARSGDTTVQRWRCLGGASKPIRRGAITLDGEGAPEAQVLAVEGAEVIVELRAEGGVSAAIARVGEVPLPPYIRRTGRPTAEDGDRYQTVYARRDGAVAAPTAGLHFTPELLAELHSGGVEIAFVTLHVGLGTFAPLREEAPLPAQLHAERYEVPPATAAAIARARTSGLPVIAVGTTVVRALETCANLVGTVEAGAGETRIFLRPGHRFRAVDGLLTNFHLPRSTLLMLVCAFAGRERVLAAYAEAVARGYRFYSYGDAMLIT
jgi:S-adenosylmethionine:tRNA ribosyltransferase-isomerase